MGKDEITKEIFTDYLRINMKYAIWKSNMKRKIWSYIFLFAMKKAYPWYDFTFFFELMGNWLHNASLEHKKNGTLMRSDKTAKEMLIASEVCKRLSTGYIEDNARIVVFGPDYMDTDDKDYKRLRQFTEKSYAFHLDLLTKMIRKHSLTWWD